MNEPRLRFRVGPIASGFRDSPGKSQHECQRPDVTIEISTHAVDGLAENDFILAAKIDMLPVELKK